MGLEQSYVGKKGRISVGCSSTYTHLAEGQLYKVYAVYMHKKIVNLPLCKPRCYIRNV